ncbi:MAG: hypothetical protein HRU03_01360 [Nanoarchaeales archaeon]|nr:hypothetical protein [Nanoarchaeales archaeon]
MKFKYLILIMLVLFVGCSVDDTNKILQEEKEEEIRVENIQTDKIITEKKEEEKIVTEKKSNVEIENSITILIDINGGYELDLEDKGRPTKLISEGLGISQEQFQYAFSFVTPAGAGRSPTKEEEEKNKIALMNVLEPLGISNDKLDEVSNYYRYRTEVNKKWRHVEAELYAVIIDGVVVSVEITNKGAGYTSKPSLSIEGFEDVELVPVISFSTHLESNGELSEVIIK